MGSWRPKFLPRGHSLKNLGKEGSNTQQGAIHSKEPSVSSVDLGSRAPSNQS